MPDILIDLLIIAVKLGVITSYSIHYTKLYDSGRVSTRPQE